MRSGINTKVILTTVSAELLHDLIVALRRICSASQLEGFLVRSGISVDLANHRNSRVTHEQLVRLYQIAAVETGDEMMGLWSRPIRSGALKVICRTVYDARSVRIAMYRFTQVWNLMLDDYELVLDQSKDNFSIFLKPRPWYGGNGNLVTNINRFGHMAMLKLAHGVASWLVGQEVTLKKVSFAFPRPPFAEDYKVLFPAKTYYDAKFSAICFHSDLAEQRFKRSYADLAPFLRRAPRDWIFTTYTEHALSMKVHDFLNRSNNLGCSVAQVANEFHMSSRTLMRRLAAEHTSFQAIKDALRRDLAIFELVNTNKSIENIAHEHGFMSVSTFHRAFKRWTGYTPGEYRRHGLRLLI